MKTYYKAVNDCDHESCGHRHRTREAAKRCIPTMMARKARTPGAAIRIEKVSE